MPVWGLFCGLGGYLLCALATARLAYGVQRSRIIQTEASRPVDGDPVRRFEDNDRASTATGAFLFGLLWPLSLPSHLAHRFARFVITARPPATEAERERRAEDLRRRIHDLEEALGVGPGPAAAQDREDARKNVLRKGV
ncbi:hypothetical protein [Streptomyces hoynatensis]|uniref:Uncharacterized protein n=1 Tax=Streptomyces hoynatensis TaxID=1141874 RepID=A0A3A9YWB3_9ACTN|nr:hypothetical protein [Streptomyces hoynatensis]RKN40079.1 hypothetical protein D7294_19390 [Streptomyces hoynatensis]